ncbi:hypothetical protein JKP88DRAFT_173712 [Tribonema minus]|uniref:PDZ domain-containing protein n=1 Tax=Tribonema minus TaxID=303371 RepID=A0A835ZHI9_9STRA|nr:hypothetical protein JKP88DRAFT_173712 [Tribonema minus]
MRVEEKDLPPPPGTGGSMRSCTVVTRVSEDGQAHGQGVQTGCVMVGVNGEQYLGHAHAVAALKHGRRPVTVRLRRAGV